jgi:hypothetical protein
MAEDTLAHRRLLCRVPLLPGESLWSYLARLAAANCYSPSMLALLCSKRIGIPGLRVDKLICPRHSEIFEALGSLGGLTPRELANASIHHFAQAPVLANMERTSITLADGAPLQLIHSLIRSRHLSPDYHVQFCPDCLREAAYHRLDWTPKDVWACLKHRRLLLDGCPVCDAWVSVQDVVRCQCSQCSANLTASAPPQALDPVGMFAQKTIRTWWGLDVPEIASMDTPLPDQPVPTLHHLFDALQDSLRAEVSTFRDVPAHHSIQLQAFKALADWPTGFCGFLRGRLEHCVRIQSYYSLCDFSRPVYLRNDSQLTTWLSGFQNWPILGFVQEAVDRFLVENNIRAEAEYRRTQFVIEADEELQRIARPLAQKGIERVAKIVESL